jgi:hypothetical protein
LYKCKNDKWQPNGRNTLQNEEFKGAEYANTESLFRTKKPKYKGDDFLKETIFKGDIEWVGTRISMKHVQNIVMDFVLDDLVEKSKNAK